jgi:uncharacterized membrane protein
MDFRALLLILKVPKAALAANQHPRGLAAMAYGFHMPHMADSEQQMQQHAEALRPVYLDEHIHPNRSLSRKGMVRVIIALAVFNIATAIFLFAIGAYPAPIFLGADFLALWFAFHLMEQKRQRSGEHIRICGDRVEVRSPSGGRLVWSSAPTFTRVVLDRSDADLPLLSLASSGRSVELGRGLGAEGRIALADTLDAAISAARNERHSSH